MRAIRKIGLFLLIVGGSFAIWCFGAGLIAIWFVTLLFVVVPGLVLIAVGREHKEKEKKGEEVKNG